MQKERLLEIIRHPYRLQSETDFPLFKELTEEFQYFSAPYILMARHLSQKKSIYFDKYLKLSAAYIGNRELLYNLIFAEEPAESQTFIVKNTSVTTAPSRETIISENSHISTAGKIPQEQIVSSDEIEAQETDSHIGSVEKIPQEQIISADEIEAQEADSHISTAGKMLEEEVSEEVIAEQNLPVETKLETELPEDEIVTGEIQEISSGENIINEPLPLTEITEEVAEQSAEEKKKARRFDSDSLQILPASAYDYFTYQKKIAEKQNANLETEAAEPEPVEPEISTGTEHKPGVKINLQEQSLSFVDWLTKFSTSTSQQKITPEESKTETEKSAEKPQTPNDLIKPNIKKPAKTDVENIISNFIRQEPKIKPVTTSFYRPEDFAQRSAEEDNSLVTETLANIYLRQGLKEKASEIFQQLITRYPQKSAYFAAKIQEIKTNQQ